MKILKKIIITLVIVIFIVFIISASKIATNGVINGLILCGNVVIPGLFPMAVMTLFLQKIGLLNYFALKIRFIKNTKNILPVYILSVIGGYPVGAKLLDNECNKTISKNNARNLLPCFINAGPAFIVSSIGIGVYNNQKIGILLLLSHLMSSVIIFSVKIKKTDFFLPKYTQSNNSKGTFTESFVSSVTEASVSMLNICGFIVLFSVIQALINSLKINSVIKAAIIIPLEVTNSISAYKNIYLTSFLLGFGGLSIILQVISFAKNYKVNIADLIFVRIINGILSAGILKLLLWAFPVDITVSNNLNIAVFSNENIFFTCCLILLWILICYAACGKNYSGNIFKDLN